jgi:hypothetical protein
VGKGLRGIEFPAIAIAARAAWRFDSLAYPAVPPCPSARDREEGPPPAVGGAGGERQFLGAITTAASGWFWRFQLHPMRPGDNSRRWGVALGGLRAPEEIEKRNRKPAQTEDTARVRGPRGTGPRSF